MCCSIFIKRCEGGTTILFTHTLVLVELYILLIVVGEMHRLPVLSLSWQEPYWYRCTSTTLCVVLRGVAQAPES